MTGFACLRRVFVAALVLAWGGPSLASAADEPRGTFIFENDYFGQPHSDRNYTHGMAFAASRLGAPESAPLRGLLGVLAAFNDWSGIERSGVTPDTRTTAVIASTNFTPDDLTQLVAPANDRPFSTLLYLGAGYRAGDDDLTTETELQFGVLGTNIGKAVQDKIHQWCCKDWPPPAGWNNQIGDGGAPTFLYHLRQLRSLTGERSVGREGRYAVIGSVGGELGYYTRALAGLSLFYGATEADYRAIRVTSTRGPSASMIASTLSRPARRDPAFAAAPLPVARGKGFSAWVDYELSAFAYNQLLQGAWAGDNNVTIPASRVQRMVHKLTAGVELTFLPRSIGLMTSGDVRLYYMLGWRSRDIKGSPDSVHGWGGIYLSYPL